MDICQTLLQGNKDMDHSLKLKVTILGSGTSTGVPTIACCCAVCTSEHPHNKRTRSSIMLTITDKQEHFVIDTTPDFRAQMLRERVMDLRYVFYTHVHADHCHGFDDLRAFYFKSKSPVQCMSTSQHLQELKQRFSYAFMNTGYIGTAPQVDLVPFDSSLSCHVGGLDVEAVELPHGNVTTLAYRFGSFAYATDFKYFPDAAIEKWKGKIHTMVASGLRFRDHPTHSTVDETLQLFKELGVKYGYITHLSHEVDAQTDAKKLPKNVSFAYDGLSFEVTT